MMSSLRTCARAAVHIQRLTSVVYTGERGIKRWVLPTIKEINKRLSKLGPRPEPRRNKFLEWNFDAELFAFNKRLSESFDIPLLQQAFTHRSYVILKEQQERRRAGIENPVVDIKDNRELIEEGKYLTSEIVKCYLRQALPRLPEEGILALKDHLLSEEVLAKVATHLGTKDIILSEDHPVKPVTLANTFLALVAALSRSVDSVHAGLFVRDFLIATLSEKDVTEIWTPDPIQTLESILKTEKRGPADFRLGAKNGAKTLLPAYQVIVFSDKEFLGIGIAESIPVAKDVAAFDALRRMFGIADFSKPIQFNFGVDISSQRNENLPITRWCSENLKTAARL